MQIVHDSLDPLKPHVASRGLDGGMRHEPSVAVCQVTVDRCESLFVSLLLRFDRSVRSEYDCGLRSAVLAPEGG